MLQMRLRFRVEAICLVSPVSAQLLEEEVWGLG